MKKPCALLCGMLCLTLTAFAQARLDTNVFIFSRILPASPTRVVTVQQNWSETGLPMQLHLQSFNTSTSKNVEKLVPLKLGPFKALVKDIFIWEGQVNLLSSVYHSGPGRSNFMLRRFDVRTLEEKESKLIDAVATPRPTSGSNYWDYAISADSNLIGFYSWIYAYAKDSVRLNVQVFDRDLQKQWSKQYTLPFLNSQFLITKCALRNNGEFFLFAENYTARIGFETVIRANRIEHLALQIRKDRDTARVIRPSLEKGAFFSGIKFGLNADQTLCGIGIWQAPRFVTESGLYLLKLPLDTEVFTQNIEELPKAMYQNAERIARQDTLLGKNYNAAGFFNYIISRIDFEPGGQIYLLSNYGEQCMLMQFDAALKLQYISLIPRLRHGFLEIPYDASLFTKGEKVYFLQTQVGNDLDSPVKLLSIGPKGELIHGKVESRINTRRPQFTLNANYCEQVDEQYIILTATDNQVPYGSPRTLTFRIEKTDEVFKTN